MSRKGLVGAGTPLFSVRPDKPSTVHRMARAAKKALRGLPVEANVVREGDGYVVEIATSEEVYSSALKELEREVDTLLREIGIIRRG